MWSILCEILNPYEAIMADARHQEMLKENEEAEHPSLIKSFFNKLFHK